MPFKPKITITEHHYDEIERMSGLGLPVDMIAHVFGVAPRTLEQYMKNDEKLRFHFHRGVANAVEKVSKTAFAMAVSGEVPAMTMFWLKTRARWKETHVHEIKTTTIEDLVNGAHEAEAKPLKLVGKDK